MKLKTKLLLPLASIGTVATAITPIATSCGKQGEDAVVGEIQTNLSTTAMGAKITVSKNTFTDKEAKEGFSVDFKCANGSQTDHVFVLDSIEISGKAMKQDKYTVKYDEEKGFYSNKITVDLKPDVPNGKLLFKFHWKESISEVSVLTKELDSQSSGKTVSVNPSTITKYDWSYTFTLTEQGSTDLSIIATNFTIFYDDVETEISNMKSEELTHGVEFTTISEEKGKGTVTLNELGTARFGYFVALYNNVKIQITWADENN